MRFHTALPGSPTYSTRLKGPTDNPSVLRHWGSRCQRCRWHWTIRLALSTGNHSRKSRAVPRRSTRTCRHSRSQRRHTQLPATQGRQLMTRDIRERSQSFRVHARRILRVATRVTVEIQDKGELHRYATAAGSGAVIGAVAGIPAFHVGIYRIVAIAARVEK